MELVSYNNDNNNNNNDNNNNNNNNNSVKHDVNDKIGVGIRCLWALSPQAKRLKPKYIENSNKTHYII